MSRRFMTLLGGYRCRVLPIYSGVVQYTSNLLCGLTLQTDQLLHWAVTWVAETCVMPLFVVHHLKIWQDVLGGGGDGGGSSARQ